MTEQELINALNDTEAERVRWMTAALTAGNEVVALKAQVNRFREILSNIDKDNYDEPTFVIQDALSLTADQCLAEVKAKAIEEYKKEQAEIMRLDIATKVMMLS